MTTTVKRDLLLFVETHGAFDLHRTVDASSGGESPSDGRRKTSLIARSGPPNLPDQIGRQRLKFNQDRGSRSQFDHGPIAMRSWPYRPTIGAKFTAKLGLICRGIYATINAKGIAPMTPSIRSHDCINWPQFSSKISL